MSRAGLALLLVVATACGAPASDRIKGAETLDKQASAEQLVEAGRAFARVGDTTRAEEYLSAALAKGADERKVTPLLIQICVHDGRFQMAIEYARPYVDKHPDDARTRFVLATLYAGTGDTARAKDHLRVVVSALPKEPDARYLLGVALRDEGALVDADAQFREYLRLAPRGAHADEVRAALLREVPPATTDAGASTSQAPTPLSIADAGATPPPAEAR